jgi:ELWxxDGT repeat protein/cysteine-rich repeat protein
VRDIHPGPTGSFPRTLTAWNDVVYFYADDGVTGTEVWRSDGTEDGTRLVRDIDPTDVTVPSFFTPAHGFLYFTANTPATGRELWRTDGTTAGTVMVKDLNPYASAYPESLASVGGTLFFYADDGAHGEELWALTPCGDGALQPGESCDDGNTADGDCCTALCRPAAAGSPCDAGDECADGRCDGAGICRTVFVTRPCDDDDPCTTDDTCGDGECAGRPIDCSDGDVCTLDTCDPDTGCQSEPLGFAQVRAAVAVAATATPCLTTRAPRRIRRLLTDAADRLALAEVTGTSTPRFLLSGLARLERAERAVRRHRRRLGTGCAVSLAREIAMLRARVGCLVGPG